MTQRTNTFKRTTPAVLLAAVATTSLGLAGAVQAQSDPYAHYPDSFDLTGVVRDFRERTEEGGHPDFEKQPDGGYGLYSCTTWLLLDDDGKPVFTGQGQKVLNQARDASGNDIAPHMANARYGSGSGYALGPYSLVDNPVNRSIVLQDSNGVDAYYIEFVSVTFNEDGTSTWTYSVEELPTGKDLSHWTLKLCEGVHNVVSASPGGYDVTDHEGIYGIKWDVVEAFSSGTFSVTLDGYYQGDDFSDANSALAKGGKSATLGPLFAPSCDEAFICYPFETDNVIYDDPSLGDAPAVYGVEDSGGVTSAESFSQWFRNVPGVNASKPLAITLHRQPGTSQYVFDDRTDPQYSQLGGFFPINGELFGNSTGDDRNFHFTYELDAMFTYEAGAGQMFTFTGDDDVYVFIDGKLVIDLSGVHSAVRQTISLDRLTWLEDGRNYNFRFFFAERHRSQSNFRIETNILLKTVELPETTAIYD